MALWLVGCSSAAEGLPGRYVVDVDRMAADGLEGVPGDVRELVVDLARDHYADLSFVIEPPRCEVSDRGKRASFECEVARVDRRRVLVMDWRGETGAERVRLEIDKAGQVWIERGERRLALRSASAPR